MHIVFVHRQGPGQFQHLARHLAADGWKVSLIGQSIDQRISGVRAISYSRGKSREILHGVNDPSMLSSHVSNGYRVAEVLDALARREGPPDIIFGHIGWGEMMFAKDVLPGTPALGYCEYYFHASGGDVGFDPSEQVDLSDLQRLRLRNSAQLTTLDQLDGGVSPTFWQRSRFPVTYQSRILVGHEGIQTWKARPDANATFEMADGTTLRPGDPVVTFVARDLEPYRGFPQFMRAAALIAERNPSVRFVVAGGDGVSYGRPREDGRTWRQALVDETGLRPEQVHFLGQIPHSQLMRLFQVSAAHVYLTYPFVLSWSFLEAMSCGVAAIASRTAPVEEVLRDGVNGRLVDFWDVSQIADTVEDVLSRPAAYSAMRSAARKTILERFELAGCISRHRSLIESLLGTSKAKSRSRRVPPRPSSPATANGYP